MTQDKPLSVSGDSIPVWLAFMLALLGIIGCIYTAQLFVPDELQSKVFMPWVENIDQEFVSNSIQTPDNKGKTKTNNSQSGVITNEPTTDLKSAKRNNLNQKLNNDTIKIPKNAGLIKPVNSQPKAISIVQTPTIDPVNNQTKKSASNNCPSLLTFTFEKNSIEPRKPKNRQRISQLKKWLDSHPKTSVLLEGFSSSKGRQESNLILSYRRSKAVKKFLVKKGIQENQITTHAFGEEAPLAGEPSTSIKNQRVSMQIKGAIECQNHSR